MRELSLFSGAGGGLLGSVLLGWRTVGAVEYDRYCCEVLEARQRDGYLDGFPIWHMDIREFNRRVAPRYRGLVDVVSAGFPCQPFSVAGKRLGENDERNMWPATIECIRVVEPRVCLLENVPALFLNPYFGTILDDLEASGYFLKRPPIIISACQEGASHTRERLFLVAHSECERWRTTDAPTTGEFPQRKVIAQAERKEIGVISRIDDGDRIWGFPDTEVCGGFDDVADWVDQFTALGNGQVPIVAATAWRLLMRV